MQSQKPLELVGMLKAVCICNTFIKKNILNFTF